MSTTPTNAWMGEDADALAPFIGTAPHDLDIDGLCAWAGDFQDQPMPRLRRPVTDDTLEI